MIEDKYRTNEWQIKIVGLEKDEIESFLETIYNDIIKKRMKSKPVNYVELSGNFTSKYEIYKQEDEAVRAHDRAVEEYCAQFNEEKYEAEF